MSRSISIRKAGTRRGQPHYSVECYPCRANYGKASVLAIGDKSRESARALADRHIAEHGCGGWL